MSIICTAIEYQLKQSAKIYQIALIICCLLLQTSCAMRPLYASENNSITKELSTIQVAEINNVSGAEFIRVFYDIIPQTEKPKYLLKVEVGQTTNPTALQKNAEILRKMITQITKYRLFDLESNKLLTEGQFVTHSSFNNSLTPYAAHVENEAAVESIVKQAAQELRLRLILYFNAKI